MLAPSKSPVVFDASRFHQPGWSALALPRGESFTFAVYGDRTGGNTGFLSDPVTNAAVITKPSVLARAI